MSIPFTCPHCGVTAQADDQYAGQTGPCASCGAAVTIPAMPAGAPPGRSNGCVVVAVVVGVLAVLLVCGGAIGMIGFTRMVVDTIEVNMVDVEDTMTQAEIAELENALGLYDLDIVAYPTTEQGLDALLQCPVDLPDFNAWNGPYIDEIPTDPWGNAYQYAYSGVGDGNDMPDLWSMGPDGQSGTEDDIAGWGEE